MAVNSLVRDDSVHTPPAGERHPAFLNGNGHVNGNLERHIWPAYVNTPGGNFPIESMAGNRQPVGPSLIETLIKLSLRRWKLLVICLALAGAGAYVAVQKFGRRTLSVEGNLMYVPEDNWKRNEFFKPPDIQTVVQLLKSPEIADVVRKEFSVPTPLPVFQRQITIQPVKATQLIGVTMEGSDPEACAQITNRLMELFIEKYSQLRAEKLAAEAARLKEEHAKAAARRDHAGDSLQKALKDRNVTNMRAEMDALAKDMAALDIELEKAKGQKVAAERQLIQLRGFLEKNAPKVSGTNKIDIALLNPERSREIEAEETALKIARQTLEQKRSHLLNQIELLRKGAIPRNEVDQARTELQNLETTIDASVRRLKSLREAPLPLVPTGPGGQQFNDPIRQAMVKQIDLQMQLDGLPDLIAAYQDSLNAKKLRQKELMDIDRDVRPLEREYEVTSTQLQKVNDDIAVVSALQAVGSKTGPTELRPWSKASADGAAPGASNHMKIAIVVFGASMLLFLGFVVAVDLPRSPKAPAANLPELGVPVLAHLPRTPPPALNGTGEKDALAPPAQHVQSLALSIGQGVTDPGSIILFTPLNDRVRIESVVADLAKFYARDGEPVLLFDARAAHAKRLLAAAIAPDRPAQVDAFLDGQTDDAADCFSATSTAAVEYTRGDLARRVSDGMMGMYRFRRLLDEMRQRYSRVLMIAPALRESADLDMLTALSEAVVLVVPDQTTAEEMDPYVQSLRSAEAPICGAVVIGNQTAK